MSDVIEFVCIYSIYRNINQELLRRREGSLWWGVCLRLNDPSDVYSRAGPAQSICFFLYILESRIDRLVKQYRHSSLCLYIQNREANKKTKRKESLTAPVSGGWWQEFSIKSSSSASHKNGPAGIETNDRYATARLPIGFFFFFPIVALSAHGYHHVGGPYSLGHPEAVLSSA